MTEVKDIDAIDDIVEMCRVMASLDVSSKGLWTLDEIKHRVKETLKMSKKKSSWTAKEVRLFVLKHVDSISQNQQFDAWLSLSVNWRKSESVPLLSR